MHLLLHFCRTQYSLFNIYFDTQIITFILVDDDDDDNDGDDDDDDDDD